MTDRQDRSNCSAQSPAAPLPLSACSTKPAAAAAPPATGPAHAPHGPAPAAPAQLRCQHTCASRTHHTPRCHTHSPARSSPVLAHGCSSHHADQHHNSLLAHSIFFSLFSTRQHQFYFGIFYCSCFLGVFSSPVSSHEHLRVPHLPGAVLRAAKARPDGRDRAQGHGNCRQWEPEPHQNSRDDGHKPRALFPVNGT